MITKALLYCTLNQPALFYSVLDRKYMIGKDKPNDRFPNRLNGHVVAVCDIEVEEINRLPIPFNHETYIIDFSTNSIDDMEVLIKLSCLSYDQMDRYLNSQKGFSGYAIHIKNLKVFDEPFTIEKLYQPIDNNFCKGCREYKTCEYAKSKDKPCKKVLLYAPQNMCYVWYNSEKYALISIQPQWLVKILNGEKTIEVRKKVLREML